MYKFNIKSTLRSAKKNKVLSFAKLFSITVSFAIVLFATAYVYFELSFDKQTPDHDKIFKCYMKGKFNNKNVDLAVTSPQMAKALVDEIPQIKEALRLQSQGEVTLKYNENFYKGGMLLYTDSNFFSFFHVPLTKQLQNPLESANNLVIAKSLAIKYFGSIDKAINKVVKLQSEECIISGVFDDFPPNCHLQFKLIQSIKKSNPEEKDWDYQSYITYIKTNSGVDDLDNLSFKVSKLVFTHSHDQIDGAKAKTWEDLKASEEKYLTYRVEPLKDVHFSNHKFDLAVTSNETYVYGTIILAILALLISLANFVNLSLADISTRLKEIAVYKTNGARNKRIVLWFVFESLAYWFVGFILALLIYLIAGNYLVKFLNLEFYISTGLLVKIGGLLFLGLILVNLILNVPQIFYIAKRKVLDLLKDEKSGRKNFSTKRSFIFIQFVLAALIIQGTFLVQKQINYIINKDKGYNSENVLMFSLGKLGTNAREAFINQLKSNTSIKNVATSWANFGEDLGMQTAFFETQEDENSVQSSILSVDAEFQQIFKFQMKEGRFFEKGKQSDFNTVILNEAAATKYQKTGSLIGKKLFLYADEKPYHIIGIAKNFNFRSLHHKIEPLIIKYAENCNKVFVKFNHSQISSVLGILQKQWEEFNIQQPLDYKFHNEQIAAHYLKEQQAKRLLLVLSIISIVIACIGLYAISYFIIIRKTKEIGIRKVNGAKFYEILTMLNKDLVKWVAYAFIIVIPIISYAMTKWLENFAYKTELSWWVFALAGIITISIALLTVSWQTWRAARRNPVEALRYE